MLAALLRLIGCLSLYRGALGAVESAGFTGCKILTAILRCICIRCCLLIPSVALQKCFCVSAQTPELPTTVDSTPHTIQRFPNYLCGVYASSICLLTSGTIYLTFDCKLALHNIGDLHHCLLGSISPGH